MAYLAVKAHVEVPPPREGAAALKPASPMGCPAHLRWLTPSVSNQCKSVPSGNIIPEVVLMYLYNKFLSSPFVWVLDVGKTLDSKVMVGCAILHPPGKGLVILVTQVRLLASAPEIFEEGVPLSQLAKSVGAHKCSGLSCIQVKMSFEKF